MKIKSLPFALLFLSSSIVYSQWTGTTTVYTTNTSAVVGIGTTTPAQKLHVKGGAALIGNGSSPGTNSGIKIVAPINSTHFNWQVAANQNVANGFEITPSTAVNGTSFTTPVITLLNTGYTGMGTNSPLNKLQIHTNSGTFSTSGFSLVTWDGTAQKGIGIGKTTQPNSIQGMYGATGTLFGDLVLNPNGGNIGISVTAPQEKLELDGNIRLNGSSRKIVFGTSGSPSDYILIQDVVSPNPFFQVVQDGTARFTILGETGNVGIGISNPTNKLDVNGTIHAKEFKASLSGWADFVFSPDYKLESLEELEKYILKNKHLPSIPTASEVQENGANLAEMNKLLLMKVEELTLYVIELNKKIEKLEKDETKN